MHIFEQIVALAAPHTCVGCGVEGSVLCELCAQKLRPVPPQCYRCGALDAAGRTCRSCRHNSALYAVHAVTTYDGAAKETIHRLKFAGARASAEDVARTIAATLPWPQVFSMVTLVPTANRRVRHRGYDHARLIARELASDLRMPYAPLLARVGDARQVGAKRVQRQAQLASAFRPLKPHLYQNQDVLLIDDVLTTGSTLEAAATVLRAAGARRVYGAVFARAL